MVRLFCMGWEAKESLEGSNWHRTNQQKYGELKLHQEVLVTHPHPNPQQFHLISTELQPFHWPLSASFEEWDLTKCELPSRFRLGRLQKVWGATFRTKLQNVWSSPKRWGVRPTSKNTAHQNVQNDNYVHISLLFCAVDPRSGRYLSKMIMVKSTCDYSTLSHDLAVCGAPTGSQAHRCYCGTVARAWSVEQGPGRVKSKWLRHTLARVERLQIPSQKRLETFRELSTDFSGSFDSKKVGLVRQVVSTSIPSVTCGDRTAGRRAPFATRRTAVDLIRPANIKKCFASRLTQVTSSTFLHGKIGGLHHDYSRLS